MTQKEKLLKKFLSNPSKLDYEEIKRILLEHGAVTISAKGSHQKFKHPKQEKDLIIPIHNNDCKDFYKKLALKWIQSTLL